MYSHNFASQVYRLGFVFILCFFFLTLYAYSQQEPHDENLQQGIWDYKHENFEEALRALRKAREKNPESSLAAYYLGITYKQLQDYKAAQKHLEDAVKLTPHITGALIELIDVLYRLDKVGEAQKWIRIAESEGIRPAQIAFLKGLVLAREGEDLQSAIDALENAKELDETLTTMADYHIGLAHLKAKELKEAKQIFKDLVKDYPSTDLAAFADQYIDAIEMREEQLRPLRLVFGAAFQYDDNVILKPSDSTVATDITDKGDFRQVYTFRGDYDYKPWEFFGTNLGYSFYYAKQSDLGFYDTVGNNFSIQPAFYTEKAMIGFPATYNHLVVNDKNYLSSASAGNLDNFMVAKNQMLQGGFLYKYKDYLWEPSTDDENRDGNEYIWSAGYYLFFAKNKGFVNVKYTANFDDTKGNNWEYFGHKATLTSLIPVFEKIKLTIVGEFFLQNFLKTHTLYDKKRLDTMYLLSSLIAVELFKGADLQFQYTFIDNGSNIEIYDYKRNVYSVGIQYKF